MTLSLPTRRLLLRRGPPVVARDSFNRADSASTMGRADIGPSWTAGAGTWGISSGRAYTATDTEEDLATLDLKRHNYTLEVTCLGEYAADGSRRLADVLFRFNDAANFLWVVYDGTNILLRKRDASLDTTLASTALSIADGTAYRLRVHVNGSVVRVWVDGALRLQHTLSATDHATYMGAAYTGAGFHLGGVAGVATTPARWDDLVVTGS